MGLAPAHRHSFHHFLEEHVARPLGVRERLHRLDGSAPDPAAEIARHASALRALGGADLVLLGLGTNGHVAFNEPGSRAADAARPTELSPSTIRELAAGLGRDVPELGITLGLSEIASGARILLLVTGAAKAGILAELLGREPSSERPASLLLGHPGLFLLADETAASRLDRRA